MKITYEEALDIVIKQIYNDIASLDFSEIELGLEVDWGKIPSRAKKVYVLSCLLSEWHIAKGARLGVVDYIQAKPYEQKEEHFVEGFNQLRAVFKKGKKLGKIIKKSLQHAMEEDNEHL